MGGGRVHTHSSLLKEKGSVVPGNLGETGTRVPRPFSHQLLTLVGWGLLVGRVNPPPTLQLQACVAARGVISMVLEKVPR